MAVDLEQPLLEKKRPALVYPNCRGCKNSYLQDADAKLPWKVLAIMAALTLVNALPISSVFPFLYFMVRDFHVAKTDKDIGFYAGYIGSAYMFGRFLTAIQWGMAADKYGRVPVMVIGVISVIIFHTMFGVSTTFWMAVLSRFLLGSCNGMLGAVKAYASEICNERHRARSVSIAGTVWGLGLIIGPAMGGYFSQPATKYPNLFPRGSLFDRYAYLLPSLLVTVIAIPTLFISFYLPETLHNHDVVEVEKTEETKGEHAVSLPIPRITSRSGSRKYSVCEGMDSPTLISPFGSLHDSMCEDELQHSGRRRSQTSDKFQSRSSDNDEECMGVGDGYKDLPGTGNLADSGNVEVEKKLLATSDKEYHPEAEKKSSLFSNKPLMGSIALYSIWSLHDIAYTEIFSLWCVSPRSDGGLGLTTTDVGQILAISGFIMLLFQLFAFVFLVNLAGAVLLSRISAVTTVLLMAVYPFVTMLHGVTLWAVLSFLSIVKAVFGTTIFTASFILLNNSVYLQEKSSAAQFLTPIISQTRDQRGAANGLGMSLVSLFKAVGPAGGGSIFAWAQSRQSYILPGNQLVFFSLGLIAFFSFIFTLDPILPRSLDKPIPEDIK